MRIIPFRSDHALDIQDAQEQQAPDLAFGLSDGSLEAFVHLERSAGMNYSIYGEDGRIAGCGGVFGVWAQRACAWMIATHDWHNIVSPRDVARFSRSILDAYPAARIEATALVDFPAAHRWLEHLGFEKEAERMRRYDPMGRDFALFARFRA